MTRAMVTRAMVTKATVTRAMVTRAMVAGVTPEAWSCFCRSTFLEKNSAVGRIQPLACVGFSMIDLQQCVCIDLF